MSATAATENGTGGSISESGDGSGAGRRSRKPPPPPQARKSSLTTQQSYDELKMKYLTTDRNYENLKQLARKGEFAVAATHLIYSSTTVYPLTVQKLRALERADTLGVLPL